MAVPACPRHLTDAPDGTSTKRSYSELFVQETLHMRDEVTLFSLSFSAQAGACSVGTAQFVRPLTARGPALRVLHAPGLFFTTESHV